MKDYALRAYYAIKNNEKGEFGLSAVLSIAIGLIVAAFVLIPGIKGFANQIILEMQQWWTSAISSQVFPK